MPVLSSVCRDFNQSSQLEWLETNGTGAFAMGTVACVSTRRYHSLLTASLKPPVERFVLFSRVDETVDLAGDAFELGACQYPGAVAPQGYQYLESFVSEPCATWRYALSGESIEKQVYLVPGRQAVVLRYRASCAATLRVRPFLAYRDYHSIGHQREDVRRGLPELEFRCEGSFTDEPHWYNNIEYLEELERGLDFREDLFTPGVWTLPLQKGEWVSICASIDGADACDPPGAKADPFVVRRADGKPTIIAGYPWFTDWGRDTMIALPGLLITPGRLDEAREILECFLGHLNNGVIPNRFPDSGEAPEYNTADATLWMFQAMRQWLAAGGQKTFLEKKFYPAAKEIITWHRRGTWFGIGVDPGDGLLSAGTPGTQLTWMDAKVGDWVVTPRHGKPVEINALWHGALCSMAEWALEVGDAAGVAEYGAAAARVRDSFRAKFWNPLSECLYDVLTPDGPVRKIRPNQIFAVSLPYGLLDRAQQQAVVRAVSTRLLTPVGLRTLDPLDPEYQSRYEGGPVDRDGAYHQGTVWPWLMGPFIDAYFTAFGRTPESIEFCSNLVRGLEAESSRHGCLGSIAEIYDADEPRYPRGCPAQAWSVAELARVRAAHGL
jgi:glycogen debranching enzyme